MNLDQFGMDTTTLAGPLERRLQAIKAAGFTQVMLNAGDIASFPAGEAAAIDVVRQSGLRVTGFQVLRDFEGLSGHLHAYKVDIAQAMLTTCRALGSRLLLVCSSTSAHAGGDTEHLARDLRKLATLAVPLDIKVAFEALSWGRYVNQVSQAWDLVELADRANLGLAIDSFHFLAQETDPAVLDGIPAAKVFLVQLSDFLWHAIDTPGERIETARHYRVFPGEGVHGTQIGELVRRLYAMGYRGDYSFEVFNDDYRELPLPVVAQRARRSVDWIGGVVAQRSLPPRLRTPG